MKFDYTLCIIKWNDSSTYNLRFPVIFCYKSIDVYAYKVTFSCADRNFWFQVLASDDIFTTCQPKQFSSFQQRLQKYYLVIRKKKIIQQPHPDALVISGFGMRNLKFVWNCSSGERAERSGATCGRHGFCWSENISRSK